MCVHAAPDGVSVSIRAHNKHRIKEGAVSSAVPYPFPAAPAEMTPDFPSSGMDDRTPGAGRLRPPEVYWQGSLKDMETYTHLFIIIITIYDMESCKLLCSVKGLKFS